MNTKKLVVIAVIMLTASFALAQNVESVMYNGLRPKVPTAVNIEAMIAQGNLSALNSRNGYTFSEQSRSGDQINYWDADPNTPAPKFTDCHHVRNGVLVIGECGNRVIKVYAERYTDEPIPGPRGFTGPVGPAGTNGANGTNGNNGTNGANGAPGICWQPEQTAAAPTIQPDKTCRANPWISVVTTESAPGERYVMECARQAGILEWGRDVLGQALVGVASRAQGSTWNVAGGTAFGGNASATGGAGGSSISQAGSYANSSSTSSAGASSTSSPRIHIYSPSTATNSTGINMPQSTAVHVAR